MSLDGHIAQLRERHRQLEARISEEQNHPAGDEFVVRNLKREKLKLKEEIERLQTPH